MLFPGTAAVLGGLLLVATTACSAQPPSEGPPAATAAPTTGPTALTDYDTSALTVVRSGFCDRVPDDIIAAALGSDAGEVIDEKVWQPGGRLPGTRDIGNEFGCAWTAGEVTARAWVFAPPITPERADDLASEVVGPSCRAVRSAPPLGAPSVARTCGSDPGAGLVGYHGLVGDAWVSCEINGGAAKDLDLVGQWCVAVLEAMRSD